MNCDLSFPQTYSLRLRGDSNADLEKESVRIPGDYVERVTVTVKPVSVHTVSSQHRTVIMSATRGTEWCQGLVGKLKGAWCSVSVDMECSSPWLPSNCCDQEKETTDVYVDLLEGGHLYDKLRVQVQQN